MRVATSPSFWSRYVTQIQDLGDDESADYQATTPRSEANRKAVVVLLTSAISLTLLNFGATTTPSWFTSTLDALGLDGWAEWSRDVFPYTVPPVLVIRYVLKERVREFGTRVKGIWPHGRVYAVLLAVSIPFVVFASYTAAFQAKYPFYNLSAGEGLWPNMTMWWVVYGLQFMALEFFFRGFMIHGLKHRLGYMAIFVMVVPYNMLHYSKPFLEAVAAIAGGIVLGSLSLRSRSVWWGAWLHISIAATMDVAALIHKGFLF